MDFRLQLIIAVLIALAVGYPLLYFERKKLKQEGVSIKHLDLKLAIMVTGPILSIPVLFLSDFSVMEKIGIITIANGIATIQYFSVVSARRRLRKMMGLPPDDEDTREVKKENKA